MSKSIHILFVSLFISLLGTIVVFQFSETVSEVEISWVDEEGESETSEILEEEFINEHTISSESKVLSLIYIVQKEDDMQSLYLDTFSPPPERI